MAIYAIGDVQGCYDALCRLLQTISFDPAHDTVWLTGDLVNRGPQSLEVLRLVRSLGERAVTVLGNHDLTLLAVAEGFVKAKRKDTFHAILSAADRDELLVWLRHRPMLHYDPYVKFVMVHAGLAPQWDLPQSVACARELESTLRGAHYRDFLRRMYGSEPRRWQESLRGAARLRFIVNCLTRIRYCDDEGTLSFADKGPPGTQGKGLRPWFLIPWRRGAELNVVFGHWASLGYYRDRGVYALDSGCVWGGRLTALCLDRPEKPYYVDCSDCGAMRT